MKNLINFKNGLIALLALTVLLIFTLSSCASVKIHKQESFSNKKVSIQPCDECDNETSYVYAVRSQSFLPSPPPVEDIEGVVKMTKRDRHTYLLLTSPIFDQKKILKKVSKRI